MPIEVLYRQLRKAKQFAKDKSEVIPDSTLVRAGYANIEYTGLFTTACYEWCMSPLKDETLVQFQAQFTKHDRDRASQNGTMQDAGYHAGNSTTGTGATEGTNQSDISALTKAIACQTTANAVQFREMMDLLKLQTVNYVSSAKNGGGRNDGDKKKYVCWSHGLSHNKDHTRSTCFTRTEGRKEEATWDNKLGGSTVNRTVRRSA